LTWVEEMFENMAAVYRGKYVATERKEMGIAEDEFWDSLRLDCMFMMGAQPDEEVDVHIAIGHTTTSNIKIHCSISLCTRVDLTK